MASEASSTVRRGALAIGGAKVWFLVVGLGQSVLLPVAIGQGGFGGFKRATAFVNLVNNVLVVASIQAVSRAVAAAPVGARREVARRALKLHAALGLALAALFLLSIPAIVAHQHAPHLARPLRALAGVLVAYGAYAAMVGALNGAQVFGAQAGLDAGYSTLRTSLMIGVGWWWVTKRDGDGAYGAAVGFFVAAVLILPFARAALRRLPPGEPVAAAFDPRAHLRFLSGLLALQAFQSLVLQVDLMILGRAVSLRAIAYGAVAPHVLADAVAGLYAQAQAFGLVPYQVLLAAGYVLFPTVAAAHARGDHGAVRDEVERGGSATLVVAGLLVAGIGGAPEAVMKFVYGSTKDALLPLELGAPVLRALAIGHGATAIAALGATLLAASGRGRLAAITMGGVAACAVGGASIGASLPLHVFELGSAVAHGLAAGLIVGAGLVAIVVSRTVGRYVRPSSLARVTVALAFAMAAGAWVPVPSRVLAALVPLVPAIVYLFVVTVLGENLRALLGLRRESVT